MAASKKVKQDPVSELKREFSNMPEKPLTERKTTLKQIVTTLSREISGMLGKGYTYLEITEKFAERDINITPTTLSSYHREVLANERAADGTKEAARPKKVQSLQVRVKADAIQNAKRTKPKVANPAGRPHVFAEIDKAAAKTSKTTRSRKKVA